MTSQTKNKNILVVEDDKLSESLIKSALGRDYLCEFVNSGKEAIEKAKKENYSFMIFDIGLKEMTGIQALNEIRKIPGYEKTPALAITAYVFNKEEIFYEGGFTHFLQKPFGTGEILKILKEN